MEQVFEQEGSQDNLELNSKLRSIEARYNMLAERLLVVNKNLIEQHKKLVHEIQMINSDIMEAKRDAKTTKELMSNIIKELENFATKDSVKVIEKYIDLLNPLNFVTEDQLNQAIEEKLKRGVNIGSNTKK